MASPALKAVLVSSMVMATSSSLISGSVPASRPEQAGRSNSASRRIVTVTRPRPDNRLVVIMAHLRCVASGRLFRRRKKLHEPSGKAPACRAVCIAVGIVDGHLHAGGKAAVEEGPDEGGAFLVGEAAGLGRID